MQFDIPILKAKATVKTPDSQEWDQKVYEYCLYLGAKTLLNRLSKVKEDDYATDNEYRTVAKEAAEKLCESLKTGEGIRFTGMGKAAKKGGKRSAEHTEAMRIARKHVESQLAASDKEWKKKWAPADITVAAEHMVETYPEIMEEAKEALAKRAAGKDKFKLDLSKLPEPTGKKPRKSAKPAEEGQLSATQAGIPAKRGAKPAQHVQH